MKAAKAAKLVLTTLIALMLVSGAGHSQVAKDKAKVKDKDKSAKRDRVRYKIRVARQWKLTEALDLDEATAKKLFPILDRYDDELEKVMEQGAELRRELQAELEKDPPDRAKINRLIDQLAAHQDELWRLSQKRFAEVRRVLAPEQAAKALFLLPELDRAVRREVRRIYKDRRKGRHRPDRDRFSNPFSDDGD